MQLRALSGFLICVFLLGGCDYFRSVPDRVERAERLIAESQYRAAAIELKGVIDKEPNNGRARLLLAQIFMRQLNPLGAQRELEVARANGVNGAEANQLELEILSAMGRHEEVLVKVSDAEFVLNEPARSLRRAHANLALQRFRDALTQFDEVLARANLSPGDMLDAQLGRIEARASLGSMNDSLLELQSLVQKDGALARGWALLGILQARSGQTDQAIESLEQAHRHAGTGLNLLQHAEVLTLTIELYLGTRNIPSAEKALQSLNKIMPGALATRLFQARIAIAKQDYATATSELQRIVSASPDIAAAQFLLGMVHLQQGNINQAEQHLTAAVNIAPQHLEARKLLAQAQLRLDRPQAAIQSLQPALDGPGIDMQVYGLLGLAEKQAGVESSSVEHLLRAVAEQPRDANRRLALATVYLRAANYDDAIVQLRLIDDPAFQAQRAAMMTMALARTQGVASARAELESQLTRHPKDVGLMTVAADFYAQTGQGPRALKLLADAIQIAPQDTSVLIARARLLTATGDVVGAERDLKAALAIKGDDRAVLLALADLNNRRGNTSSAIEWLEKLSALDPGDVQVELLKARVLLSTKQPKATQQADELLGSLVKANAERSDVRASVARLYISAGHYEQALTQLRAAAAIAKQDVSIQLEIARTQIALSQFDDARSTVGEILQSQPTWLPGVALGAWLDVERHANDAALARMAALRKLHPDDAQVCAAQGEIFWAVGKPEQAAEAFEKALQIQPNAQIAIKAYVARKAAHLGNAAAPLERYVSLRPFDLAARGGLAQAYQDQGDLKRAVEQYEKMLTGPASAALLNNLAWLYSELGDARALATARAALALAPRSAAVADTLGWVLVKQGNHAEALSILKSAATEAPTEPEIRYHYAVALARSGAREEARGVLQEALRQSGQFPSRVPAEELLKALANGPGTETPKR